MDRISGKLGAAMLYELYLRIREPSDEIAQRVWEGVRAEAEPPPDQEEPWELRRETGVISVRMHPAESARWDAPETDAPLGVDLAVAAGAGEALARELVDHACDWATRWDLLLYDPQLGRTVTADDPEDIETVIRRIKQHSDYLTDTVGLGDGPSSYVDVDHDAPLLGWRAKFYLFGAGLLAVLALAAHYCR